MKRAATGLTNIKKTVKTVAKPQNHAGKPVNYWKMAMKYAKKVNKNLKVASKDHEGDSPTDHMNLVLSKGMISAVKDGHLRDKIDIKKDKNRSK